ncbi:hypothetical protein RhiirB3_408944 [Rhizophagus irregularis]|nr:hypothetical protein RhiirB3_408944 [Rhizophagus irregularis]
MGLALINEVLNSYEYQEKYKILEQEIYKLLISNCKNITDFNWFTTLPLYQYPGASTFFSQLRTLFFISSRFIIFSSTDTLVYIIILTSEESTCFTFTFI